MTKRGVIFCLLSLVLVAYMAVALAFARASAAREPYAALRINIAETPTSGFVTAAEIDDVLGGLSNAISSMPADSVSTLLIEQRIEALDNIERANCVVLNNREVQLDVMPIVPVARVIDTRTGENFYINAAGKAMKANPRYRVDVPVITGRFSESLSPVIAVPLLRHFEANPAHAALASAIAIEPNGDLVMVPRIKGHLVNLGDTSIIDNKFERLLIFYRDVLPVKGWEYYDMVSVKWDGQVVAKRRDKRSMADKFPDADEAYIDDASTMDAATAEDPSPQQPKKK